MDYKRLGDLVKRFQQGDKEAFDYFYSSMYDSQYYYALKMIKDTYAAEDIVQEAFIKAYRYIGSIKNPQTTAKWMMRVTYSCCIDYMNKSSNKELLTSETTDKDDESIYTSDSIFGSIEDSSNSTIKRMMVSEALDELKPEIRATVILRYYNDFKIKDIAEIMGIPENTVKTRLHYAKKKLQGSLKVLYSWAPGITLYLFFLEDAHAIIGSSLVAIPELILGSTLTKTVAVTTAVLAGATITTSQIAAQNLPVIDNIALDGYREVATSQDISVKTHDGVDVESVALSDGTLLTKTEDGWKYTFTKDGDYSIIATTDSGRTETKDITISNIDSDSPSIDADISQDGIVSFYLSDDTSGIDWDSISMVGDISDWEKYPSDNKVMCIADGTATMKVSDKAGNWKSVDVKVE